MQTQSATRTDLGGGNPAFSDKIQREYLSGAISAPKTMSVGGITVKTIVLLIVLVAAAAWGWASATEPVTVDLGTGYANTTVTIPGGFWLASFGALIVGIMVAFNPRRAALLGVIYAALEGYVLGAISAMFDAQSDGIVGAAVIGTALLYVFGNCGTMGSTGLEASVMGSARGRPTMQPEDRRRSGRPMTALLRPRGRRTCARAGAPLLCRYGVVQP